MPPLAVGRLVCVCGSERPRCSFVNAGIRLYFVMLKLGVVRTYKLPTETPPPRCRFGGSGHPRGIFDLISPTHKRTEGRTPVWGSEFTSKDAALQGGSSRNRC
jgi:hypothetical protein